MDVLNYILNNEQQSSNAHTPDLTGFGNNRLSGDIGDFSGLTVRNPNQLRSRVPRRTISERLTQCQICVGV